LIGYGIFTVDAVIGGVDEDRVFPLASLLQEFDDASDLPIVGGDTIVVAGALFEVGFRVGSGRGVGLIKEESRSIGIGAVRKVGSEKDAELASGVAEVVFQVG